MQWWMMSGDGDDLKRMEDEEHAKSSFLKDGQTDCQAGELERQSTIRIWSEAELLCRELAIETIIQSKTIGNFKSNLDVEIRAKMMDRQKQKDQNLETKPQENLKDGSDQQLEEAQEQERIPEGRKMDKHVTIKP